MQRTRKILSDQKHGNISDETVYREVCLDVSEHLKADLVSIWYCCDGEAGIECQYRYDANEDSFSKGQKLMKTDCQFYFETMVEYNCISAPDVRTHPATKELVDSYFAPNGIVSLLDFILHEDFKPIGVICCENRSDYRYWNDADKAYLRSLASLISHRFCPR